LVLYFLFFHDASDVFDLNIAGAARQEVVFDIFAAVLEAMRRCVGNVKDELSGYHSPVNLAGSITQAI
jgi:hypothetical protein